MTSSIYACFLMTSFWRNTWTGVMVDYWYCVAGGGVFLLLLLGCACCVRYRCVKVQQPRFSHSSGLSTTDCADVFYSNWTYYQGMSAGKQKLLGKANSRKSKSPNPGQGYAGGERPSSVSSVHSEGDYHRQAPAWTWEDRPSSTGSMQFPYNPLTMRMLSSTPPSSMPCASPSLQAQQGGAVPQARVWEREPLLSEQYETLSDSDD